jgi:1-acyl-sn-glycerol-3-phosphate acyltransferase
VTAPPTPSPILDGLRDLAVTLALWVYFTLGFVVGLLPLYLFAWYLPGRREAGFQRLNHWFYRGFFRLAGWLMPGLSIHVDPAVKGIRGGVVVANHLSYLDPLLCIALFPRQKTIVKRIFFQVPVFRWFIRTAGYLPASAEGPGGEDLLRQLEGMGAFFDGGGVLFVFPEGTRSRDGALNAFHPSAFKIARRWRVPVHVLRIRGTDGLFRPGRFRFEATRPPRIRVEAAGRLETFGGVTAGELSRKARELIADSW